MPARTVCFAGVRKFDGTAFRNLTGGEYIQMSGRAGRRGIDESGNVILLFDQKLEPTAIKDIVRGRADALLSAFRLSFSSLLSVLRVDVDQITPEMLISRSLRQWQMRRDLPAMRMQLAATAAAANDVVVEDEAAAEEVLQLLEERGQVAAAMCAIEAQPQYAVPFLQPGRLVRLATAAADEGEGQAALPGPPLDVNVPTGGVRGVWVAVLSFERMNSGKGVSTSAQEGGKGEVVKDADEALNAAYVVDVLARVRRVQAGTGKAVARRLCGHADEDGEPLVVAVPLSQVVGLGAPRIILPKEILTQEARCVVCVCLCLCVYSERNVCCRRVGKGHWLVMNRPQQLFMRVI
jgi:ATP-dependent RNA helicase DOB1